LKKQYEALAELYDQLMYDADYKTWSDYLSKLLQEGEVPKGAKLLEYACGTGNLTYYLSQNGYHMIGVDQSEEMLNIAQNKTRSGARQVTYACADMCSFQLSQPVDAVICACDGVNYLLDSEQLMQFFAHAYGNMKEGGLFLFDISSYYKLSTVLGNEFFYDDGDEITYFWKNQYEEKTKLIQMEITMFIAEGTMYRREDEVHMQRAWESNEILFALEKAGFSRLACYSFLSKHPVADTDERIQFVAYK
jgi:ubiquinone/menaquinone biosynthesis C-methylase UbiE